MNTKDDVSRITIDIPAKSHRQLKALSPLVGKTMRELVIESIETYLQTAKLPNKKKLKALQDAEGGDDLVNAVDLQDLFRRLHV